MEKKKGCANLSEQTRAEKKVPRWLSIFSNKFLPPLFFLIIAVLAFHYMPRLDSTSLRINLGVVTIAASSLSLYLAMLTI